jgi:transcription initiation factor TFIIA large subunit
VYRYVIDDVINNVRRDFEDMGVDETIMHELQRVCVFLVAKHGVDVGPVLLRCSRG